MTIVNYDTPSLINKVKSKCCGIKDKKNRNHPKKREISQEFQHII